MPSVSYPTFDQPPSYEDSKPNDSAVGQLIDLGFDTNTSSTAPVTSDGTGDILGQLADLGKERIQTRIVKPVYSDPLGLQEQLYYLTIGGSPTLLMVDMVPTLLMIDMV